MSLHLQEHLSLRPYNTLAVDVRARYFVQVDSVEQLCEALRWAKAQQLEVLLLGGGSNLVLSNDFAGLVLQLNLRGIDWLENDAEQAVVRVQAGENWHEFVQWSLAQGLSGLENLSLIPGSVGAAPVQNIGAYGVETKDSVVQVQALERDSLTPVTLTAAECDFAYRDSVFKQQSNRWVITSVDFRLSRTPELKLGYGPIQSWLTEQGIDAPTAMDVSRAVMAIRQSKLPDPAQLANTGSFFKNPIVSAAQAQRLQHEFPQLVSYPMADGQVKLAAGWLIEQAGWKGFRQGDAGVHAQQALVLVNYGQATGRDILELASRIQADINQRFAVQLEIEPVVYR